MGGEERKVRVDEEKRSEWGFGKSVGGREEEEGSGSEMRWERGRLMGGYSNSLTIVSYPIHRGFGRPNRTFLGYQV